MEERERTYQISGWKQDRLGEGLQNTIQVPSFVWVVHCWTPYSACMIVLLWSKHADSWYLYLLLFKVILLEQVPKSLAFSRNVLPSVRKLPKGIEKQNDVRAFSQVSFLLYKQQTLCIPFWVFMFLFSLPMVRFYIL